MDKGELLYSPFADEEARAMEMKSSVRGHRGYMGGVAGQSESVLLAATPHTGPKPLSS